MSRLGTRKQVDCFDDFLRAVATSYANETADRVLDQYQVWKRLSPVIRAQVLPLTAKERAAQNRLKKRRENARRRLAAIAREFPGLINEFVCQEDE